MTLKPPVPVPIPTTRLAPLKRSQRFETFLRPPW